MQSLNKREREEILSQNAVGVRTLAWVNFALQCLVVGASLVPGFCYPEPVGGASPAVPHIIWSIFNFFTLTLVLVSSYAGFMKASRWSNLLNKLMGAIVFTIISVVINVTHAVLTLIEVVQMPSDLSVGADRGYLIALLVFLWVFAVWQVWLLARTWTLRRNVRFLVGPVAASTMMTGDDQYYDAYNDSASVSSNIIISGGGGRRRKYK